MQPCTWVAPMRTAASELATAHPESLWKWAPTPTPVLKRSRTAPTTRSTSNGRLPPLVSHRTRTSAPAAAAAASTSVLKPGLARNPSKKCSASRNTRLPWETRYPTESATMSTASVREVRRVSVTCHSADLATRHTTSVPAAIMSASTGSVADRPLVHGRDGDHLGRGAGEEGLFGGVEIGPEEVAHLDLVAEVAGDGHDRVLGDAFERAGGQRGRDDPAVADDEQVLAGALADVALGREEDGLVVAGLEGLYLGHRRVDVHAGPLGRGRHGVGVVALPRADLHPDPVGDPLVTEVGPPGPHRDGDVDRAGQRVEPHLAVAQVDDGPDVALLQTVDPHGGLGRLDDLVGAERNVDHEDLGRVEEAHDVVGQAEDGRTGVRRVGPDALEDAAAVVQRMGEHMDAGGVPVDQLAVHPDLLGGRDGHR